MAGSFPGKGYFSNAYHAFSEGMTIRDKRVSTTGKTGSFLGISFMHHLFPTAPSDYTAAGTADYIPNTMYDDTMIYNCDPFSFESEASYSISGTELRLWYGEILNTGVGIDPKVHAHWLASQVLTITPPIRL